MVQPTDDDADPGATGISTCPGLTTEVATPPAVTNGRDRRVIERFEDVRVVGVMERMHARERLLSGILVCFGMVEQVINLGPTRSTTSANR